MVLVNPFGPHQCAMCRGSVQASNTSARGASKTRDITISRSAAGLAPGAEADAWLGLFFSLATLVLLGLQLGEVVLESVEAFLPEAAVLLDPGVHVFERAGVETARPPLRLPAARDQAGALEDLEVLGD